MKMERIMVPVDFSSYGDAAIAFASTLAKESGATLDLVHVYEEPFAYTDESSTVPPADLGDDRTRLEAVRPDDPEVSFQHEFLIGHPADKIVEYAGDRQVDLIVMATHGRTGLARLLMGSVTESVLRRAPCPTLTVRMPASQSSSNTE